MQLEPGKLDISASSPDLGEANEELEIDYKGDSITVGFNARYLVDVLSVHSEGGTVELGLTDAVGPATIKSVDDSEYTYVLMPMRL